MDLTLQDLKNTECVVNWNVGAIRQEADVGRIVKIFKGRLKEKHTIHTWKALNMLLFLSYENFALENSLFDSSYLRHGEEIIQNELWVRKHNKAAQHVLQSSWAHFYLKMGNLKSALNCMSKVTPYTELSNEDKAFVLALKACFFMAYGPPGNEEASKIFTEVLALNQDEAEWYHLKGECLARIRRLHYRSKPTSEELALLRKAVEMNKECSRYLIHLARSTADLASAVRHSRTSVQDFKLLAVLETDVESTLRQAVKLSVDSPHLMCHIAKSFFKLSHYFRMRNKTLTKFCVTKALETSPMDSMVNHTVGLYHAREGDVEQAVHFLTKASDLGNYGATCDLCRLKWRESRSYDPVPDLMEVVKSKDQFAVSEAHSLLATYYFFEKEDLLSAVKHWEQWHQSRATEEYLITSCFLGQESFDFTSVLYDEIRLELRSARYSNDEDRLELKKAVDIINTRRPELQRKEPSRQRQDLIDKAQMLGKLGRAFPDAIVFMRKEQAAKRKNQPFGIKEVTNKKGRKMCVSSKYNAFARKNQKKKDEGDKEKNEIKVFDRRSRQKPFWRPPPKRHASAEDARTGSVTSKSFGSGRVTSVLESKLRSLSLASVDSLLLLKSYEESGRKVGDRSSFGARRSGNHESLTSNASYAGRRPHDMRSRTMSSEQVSRDGSPGFSTDRHSNRSRNSSCSESEPLVNWRRGETSRPEQGKPRSTFFQSFATNEVSPSARSSSVSEADDFPSPHTSRPTSRSSMSQAESTSSVFSRNNRGQGDRFEPLPHASSGNRENSWNTRSRYETAGHGDAPAPFRSSFGKRESPWKNTRRDEATGHGDMQSRSRGRGNYVPRGGSFSRGGQRPRGRGVDGSETDVRSAFSRLNLR